MAKMVHHGLFVGNGGDVYKFSGSILHCAKDPWYVTAAANIDLIQKFGDPRVLIKGYPRFLCPNVILINYNEMALNMIDSDNPAHFSDEMINAGLEFITDRMAEGDPVLVHCNMGASRSPSIAMLWMWDHGFLDNEWRYALSQFKELYNSFCPTNGIREYLKYRIERNAEHAQSE